MLVVRFIFLPPMYSRFRAVKRAPNGRRFRAVARRAPNGGLYG